MNKETLTIYTDEEGTITHCNADGELHNPDGPALVYADGDKWHYRNGRLHNENGPAIIEDNGNKKYYINGKRHNPNGPAIVYADGHKEYWINNERLTEAEFKTWQAKQSAPLHNKTATIDGIKYTLKAK